MNYLLNVLNNVARLPMQLFLMICIVIINVLYPGFAHEVLFNNKNEDIETSLTQTIIGLSSWLIIFFLI